MAINLHDRVRATIGKKTIEFEVKSIMYDKSWKVKKYGTIGPKQIWVDAKDCKLI